MLLVDEAQNIPNTERSKTHLEAMHLGIGGSTKVQLVCLGLGNTVKHLATLGLSRLASDHARSIEGLSDEDARTVVTGTLRSALTDHAFDGGELGNERENWIATAANAILSESSNYPHHLANGCHALARLVLKKGIVPEPPVAELITECRRHKRETTTTHDCSPRRTMRPPWQMRSPNQGVDWTPVDDVIRVLMAAEEHGTPVQWETANTILNALRTHGYVERHAQSYRPALPSLASHFAALRGEMDPRSQSVQAIQKAKAECISQAALGKRG